MICPKCGSKNIKEEDSVDFVEWDKEENVEYVYWFNKCLDCKYYWSDAEGEKG